MRIVHSNLELAQAVAGERFGQAHVISVLLGEADARIERLGLSATYDGPRAFVRAAWDPKVNFTAQDMLRLSVGGRF